MEGLNINQLSFSYGENKIFENFNLRLDTKKIYALVGKSGKGKSTLARIISGHLKNYTGEVKVQNIIMNRPSRHVFIVHQEDDLFPWLTVYDQLRFVAEQLNVTIDLEELLQIFKLQDSKTLYPYQLSGGMKKRLALVRAEIVSPKVLILDETLSSLDPELLNAILGEMVPRWKQKEMVVILISHQYELIKSYIDEKIQL